MKPNLNLIFTIYLDIVKTMSDTTLKFYGFYSRKCHDLFGASIYKDSTGKEFVVTHVLDKTHFSVIDAWNADQWDDKILVSSDLVQCVACNWKRVDRGVY